MTDQKEGLALGAEIDGLAVVEMAERLVCSESRIRRALETIDKLKPPAEGEWKKNPIGIYLRHLSAIRQVENLLRRGSPIPPNNPGRKPLTLKGTP